MKYSNHDEAVIVSCFFNPTKSAYRRRAFDIYYESIRHLNHRIYECVFGDGEPELSGENVTVVRTESKAWHKETLINKAVAALPEKFKYVFWIDADVIFTNPNWMTDAARALENKKVVQLFEYGIHLEKDELKPSFDVFYERRAVQNHSGKTPYTKMWRSFAATFVSDRRAAASSVYDHHGHVGFAWGARRELLDKVPLFDKALIGGADHLIAHASVGQLMSPCITKSFGRWFGFWWSLRWYWRVRGSLGYVPGDLYHIWHGDIKKREYLKRIRDFTPMQKNARRGDDGFYRTEPQAEQYFEQYIENRDVVRDVEPAVYSSSEATETSQPEKWSGFGGGADFAGGGAGGSWSNDAPSASLDAPSISLDAGADASAGISENFS
jgi:hypothetical protein